MLVVLLAVVLLTPELEVDLLEDPLETTSPLLFLPAVLAETAEVVLLPSFLNTLVPVDLL